MLKRTLVTIAAAGSLALSLGACGGQTATQESATPQQQENVSQEENTSQEENASTAQTTEQAATSSAEAEAANTEKTEAAATETEEQAVAPHPVSSAKEAKDAVFEVCPISSMQASNVKVADKKGEYVVTFGSEFGDFAYRVNAETGEITNETDAEVMASAKKVDPSKEALDACLQSVGCTLREAQNARVSLVGQQYKKANVDFDWNGEHYSMEYDVATKTITQR